MKVYNFMGYMLGNANHIVVRGDQWCDAGEKVFVCTNKETAKTILRQSQCYNLEPNNVVWTTIYRVWARDINVDEYTHGKNLAWTTEGNKIIVDSPVFYRKAPMRSEQQLQQNAMRNRADFFKLANQAWKEKMK